MIFGAIILARFCKSMNFLFCLRECKTCKMQLFKEDMLLFGSVAVYFKAAFYSNRNWNFSPIGTGPQSSFLQ